MAIGQFAPINYAGMQQTPDIGDSILQGLKIGQAFRQGQDQRAALAEADATRKQYATDLQAAFDAKTPEAFASLSAKYPTQREAFKQSWEILNQDQKDSQFRVGVQAYGALRSGQTDVAAQLLDEQIAAATNAKQPVDNLKMLRTALDTAPEQVQNQLGLALSSIDPKKWSDMTTELRNAEKAPSELTEVQAKAAKAAVESKYADAKAVQDLIKGGWDITQLQNDIDVARENSRIAALNAAIAREGNDLRRQELQQKLVDAQTARDEKVQQKAADLESGRASIDNMLGTIGRVKLTPAGTIESATGTVSSKTPTFFQDVADFEELVSTLKSQAFLAQVPMMKSLGALSDAEGKKLEASLQNLSLRQSSQRLMDNVSEAERLLILGRENLAKRYGMPAVAPNLSPLANRPMVGTVKDGFEYKGGDPADQNNWARVR
jgi:hypothetical protein